MKVYEYQKADIIIQISALFISAPRQDTLYSSLSAASSTSSIQFILP